MLDIESVRAEIASWPPVAWENVKRGANEDVQVLSSVAKEACSAIRGWEESVLDVFAIGTLPSHQGMGEMTSFQAVAWPRFDGAGGVFGRSREPPEVRGTWTELVKCMSRRVMRSR